MYLAYSYPGLSWWWDKNITCHFRKMLSHRRLIIAACPHSLQRRKDGSWSHSQVDPVWWNRRSPQGSLPEGVVASFAADACLLGLTRCNVQWRQRWMVKSASGSWIHASTNHKEVLSRHAIDQAKDFPKGGGKELRSGLTHSGGHGHVVGEWGWGPHVAEQGRGGWAGSAAAASGQEAGKRRQNKQVCVDGQGDSRHFFLSWRKEWAGLAGSWGPKYSSVWSIRENLRR